MIGLLRGQCAQAMGKILRAGAAVPVEEKRQDDAFSSRRLETIE